MSKKNNKKVTTVQQHPMHVPVSKKKSNMNYDKKNIVYPTKKALVQPNSDEYDHTIAVWCDYFNKKFNTKPSLEPNVVKALIASESDFIFKNIRKKDLKNPDIAIPMAIRWLSRKKR